MVSVLALTLQVAGIRVVIYIETSFDLRAVDHTLRIAIEGELIDCFRDIGSGVEGAGLKYGVGLRESAFGASSLIVGFTVGHLAGLLRVEFEICEFKRSSIVILIDLRCSIPLSRFPDMAI